MVFKQGSKKSEGSAVNLTIQAAAVVSVGIVWLLSGGQMPAVGDFLVLLLVGLLFTLAYLSFIRALSVGEVGIVVPLANTYPLITLLMAAVFFSLAFSGLQVGVIGAIIVGAMLLGTEHVRCGDKSENI